MLHSVRLDDIARFARDLDPLAPAGTRIGVGVSGGPDSLALLLLAAAARPGELEVATVDHGLRADSRAEAEYVAEACRQLGILHRTLPVEVGSGASLQAQARQARYAGLSAWATERNVRVLLTAHHADDQAETLLMRLARGGGLAGLAGIRRIRPLTDSILLARPLLGWRKAELEQIVARAGLTPAHDPANSDPRHDRSRARALIGELDPRLPMRLAASAAHLAQAEAAMEWMVARLKEERVSEQDGKWTIDASALPAELRRRLLLEVMRQFDVAPPRGQDLDRALAVLEGGASCTLAGLRLSGGACWRIAPAPPRTS